MLSVKVPLRRTHAPLVNLKGRFRGRCNVCDEVTHDLAADNASLVNTAWRVRGELPSVMTANATFACLRIDLTHPFTSTGRGVTDGEALPAKSCLMVGGRVELEVDTRRRKNILCLQHPSHGRPLETMPTDTWKDPERRYGARCSEEVTPPLSEAPLATDLHGQIRATRGIKRLAT